MNTTIVLLAVYVAVALVVGAVLLLLRDLGRRRGPSPEEDVDRVGERIDLSQPRPVVADESWFTQLVTQTGADLTAETAALMAVAAGLALGGGVLLWRDDWMAAAAGAVLGILVVGTWLFIMRARRHGAIREQLPEVTDLMARAVRAGESLDQAIALASNSSFRPLAGEFRRCASQMEMGLSLDAALRGLVRRAPLAEIRVLVMTLIVQRQKGGNLPTALERMARVFRDRLSYYRQFRASTAAGRGSAVLIVLIALGLDLVVIFGRTEYARDLLVTTPGRTMLAAALVLQVIGTSWALWLFRSNY
jgi:tight adherence protein B